MKPAIPNFRHCRAWIITLLLPLFALNGAAQTPGETAGPEQLLLKDYHPRSIYEIPQTRVEKARYAVIDAHSHAYAKTEADVDAWVRGMDAAGIEKTVILSGATGKAFDDIFARYKARHPDRFEVWCGFDYTGYDQPGFGPGAAAELERCHRAGATGVGEIIDKGRGLRAKTVTMHLDDPRMDPLLEKCADLGLPINIHVGEDRWMYEPMDGTNDGLMNAFQWKIPTEAGVLTHDEVLATLENAVKKHPRVTFIACHFANCCSGLGRLGEWFDRYPNLYADNSARYEETAPIPRFVSRFYDRYQDRLLYGTDMGSNVEMYRTTFRILETEDEHFYPETLGNYHWPLHGFGLKDGVLEKVYRGNLLGILKNVKRP
ncbi:MAG TPA: amidohydrolase family protein [bacterium]|nr:amidohydrolase family protein [bacterium]